MVGYIDTIGDLTSYYDVVVVVVVSLGKQAKRFILTFVSIIHP